jgi:type III secretion system (T3SS) SseB-like protein
MGDCQTRPKPGQEDMSDTDLDALADAVARATYRLDGPATGGFDPGDVTSAAAAGLVHAALQAVGQRQRTRHPGDPDVPLDPEVFDAQTLRDLGEFLRHTREGMLTSGEVADEARLWHQLLPHGWPSEASDAPPVARAIELLTSLPAEEVGPVVLTPVEPVNDLERVMVAVAADEATRPDLWQALHDGEVVLPVVAYELIRPEGAHLQLLAVPLDETPLILGFTSEERFAALLPEGGGDGPGDTGGEASDGGVNADADADADRISRIRPRGRDLPRFWPAGHWLVLDPGYENQVVLSPWEIAGLPLGPRARLPHPRATRLRPVAEDDPRVPVVGEVVGTRAAIDHVTWAQVRPAGGDEATWQDFLVVTVTPPADEAAEARAVRELSQVLPAEDFVRAVVLARQADDAHPFVEAVVAEGRRLP